MEDPDKTKMYSDDNKTSVYTDSAKRTKESVHNLKAGDKLVLKDTECSILEIISESTGEAVIYKIKNSADKIYGLKLYYEFHSPENEPNIEALNRIKNIEDDDILNLIDFGTGTNKYKGKYCFEISDFALGFDLLCVKDLKEKYSPPFIVDEVIPQIYKGILRLHENKIYHCDLKPQNIFFLDKEQKEIVIGDYGSAKTFDFSEEKKSRKTTTVKGTDFYLPPEQARGFISEKNDYYSFGMILLHLLYPEKILLDESKPKSLNYSKLKNIIERQFEAKPIIDFNPQYKKINSLIEGLTLVDFNLRWGKEQVEQWIKGEEIKVMYQKSTKGPSRNQISAEKKLNFGKYIINTPNDLRDYILTDKNWYQDLIEDRYNWNDFNHWALDLYFGDKRKRSTFNRVVNYYSQEGIDFIAEAIIRFFIPGHPVIFGFKSFDFIGSYDLKKTTAEAFSYLISELWSNSSDKDIQLYFFRYEFALRQIKDKQEETIDLLNVLYKELNTKGKMSSDFYNYKVYAYTSVSKKSLTNIKKFLCEYLPATSKIDFISFDNNYELQYKIGKSLIDYFREKRINNAFISVDFEDTISVKYSEDYYSEINLFNKIVDVTINNICNKHHIEIVTLAKNDLDLFSHNFLNAYNELLKKLTSEYNELIKKLPVKTKRIKLIQTNLKKIKSVIFEKKYHKIKAAFSLIVEIESSAKEEILLEKEREEIRKHRREDRRIKVFVYTIMGVPIIFILALQIPDFYNFVVSVDDKNALILVLVLAIICIIWLIKIVK